MSCARSPTRSDYRSNAPPSPVSLAFRPGVREPLLRRFVQAALTAVELSADNASEQH
jgi:hypothetical protein